VGTQRPWNVTKSGAQEHMFSAGVGPGMQAVELAPQALPPPVHAPSLHMSPVVQLFMSSHTMLAVRGCFVHSPLFASQVPVLQTSAAPLQSFSAPLH
jgi:hypothetical protein